MTRFVMQETTASREAKKGDYVNTWDEASDEAAVGQAVYPNCG